MMLVFWILLLTGVVLGLLLAAVSGHGRRQRAGAWTVVGVTGVLLLLLGDDLIAVGWLLLAAPLMGLAGDVSPAGEHSSRPSAGHALLAGVLMAGLFGALDLVVRRVDWQALPAGAFEARTAELGARLVSGDLVVAVGLALAWALAVTGAGATTTTDVDGGTR